ncbi:MAG: peptide chain release factor N(5)-glutamine methyltransferase, partial [Clostridia bacterium]|nr:peptide chain release factor N(5)-glutamine methyltransferase [Clostridia bacterium]
MRLSDAVGLLKDAGIEDAKREARIIFRELCKKSELDILDKDCESPLADEAVLRRCKREPLQYIIGKVGFFGEEYFVSPACLIPRADTEILVEQAVKRIPEGEYFIDLCTGSGCIAISTLSNTKNTRCVAVDISEDALLLAKKNAEHNGVSDRIELLNADAVKKEVEGEFFALLSNPPYIRKEVYEKLETEIFHEPKIALVAEDGGLFFYKRIIPLYKNKIKKGGFMAFEIGYVQG